MCDELPISQKGVHIYHASKEKIKSEETIYIFQSVYSVNF